MSEALQKLENVFSEETFTRRPLLNYTTKYFVDLSGILNDINDTNDINSAIETAKMQLDKNPNHISALYANGFLNLKIENYSEMSLEKLLGIFKNAKKWNIVEFVSQKILDEYYESDYALRYLASYYQSTNRDSEALEIWERLIRFDISNPELPEKIAHTKELAGDINSAVHYYKIAFERNLIRERNNAESDIKKVLEYEPDNYNYLLKYENALKTLVDSNIMIDVWKIIFFYYFENNRYNDALKTIKNLLNYEQDIVAQNNKKAKFFRHRLVDVYKALYPNHTLFEKIEEISSITNVNKKPKDCIEIFEKYIQYDVDKYVIHRNFGVGKIKSIDINNVNIKFVSQEDVRKMTFDMAIQSLTTLPNDDINVYKAYKLNEIKKIAEENPTELLTIILKYKKTITTKDLKQELTSKPDVVVAESAYTKWLESAKKSVRASTTVKFDKNTFLYNEEAETYDAESLSKFNKTDNFFERYQIYMEYLTYTPNLNSEEAKEMNNYFVNISKDKKAPNDERIISTIYLRSQSNVDSSIPLLSDIVKNIDDYTHVYEVLPSSNYREKFIKAIWDGRRDDYYNIILKMLYSPQVKNNYLIVNKLFEDGKTDMLAKTIDDIFLHYRECPESFVYFAQKILDGEYYDETAGDININKNSLMIGLLSIIPHLSKMVDKKETSAQARKLLKVVYDLVFDKAYLLKFIENESEDDVKIIFGEFQKLVNLEQHYKTDIISAVIKRFPDWKI
ncbi:transcript cleavage factor [Brachyspira hyodysenteriae]|uniref:Transcript cleavage factor/TPR domain containing protein n=1 Tax=Brachyspira hyodysenteriae (strain ATCC 49526 / WA1) TaxID=565034 RepID=A0A3B6V8V1_BRAHW|nr:transcript cleavage factor [Brachyspira hyodysenteriae]ACN83295.1 putative transcript cleavage factor/TPR domain containing protein [Brachyspira hyodysenteriae WA1]KLI47638.1 transcript cleavage factor [Brachyspira hyodysenteriae]KLI56361.1 transcript cleavage factor [Brachyspira hyodysenteriae]MCZ9885785.1 transcript cleavage factor [Brachyspira hyodysenteriae]MCZ9888464.1 transcript cleavage factor [Brachyspira hyodysenteriae]